MALSNLDKENTFRLLESIHNIEKNDIEKIKNNYSSFSKLEIIADQLNNLMLKANEIINDCKINEHLNNIPMNNKKVPGTYYYHYSFNNKEFLSIIAPDEWQTYEKFLGKYLYNYDCIFYRLE